VAGGRRHRPGRRDRVLRDRPLLRLQHVQLEPGGHAADGPDAGPGGRRERRPGRRVAGCDDDTDRRHGRRDRRRDCRRRGGCARRPVVGGAAADVVGARRPRPVAVRVRAAADVRRPLRRRDRRLVRRERGRGVDRHPERVTVGVDGRRTRRLHRRGRDPRAARRRADDADVRVGPRRQPAGRGAGRRPAARRLPVRGGGRRDRPQPRVGGGLAERRPGRGTSTRRRRRVEPDAARPGPDAADHDGPVRHRPGPVRSPRPHCSPSRKASPRRSGRTC
jgi:hypothetical protein